MVRIDFDRSRAVWPIVAKKRPTGMRSMRPVPMQANSAQVPPADRMLKLNFAAYGAAFATTGGRRRIAPSRPGHPNTKVALSRIALTGVAPHSNTKMTSRM